MEIAITPLAKSELLRQIKDIMVLDQVIVGERWSEINFLFDLPEKWELSLQILAEERIAGFLIASLKNQCIHIHRLAVSNQFQNLGLGKQMVNLIQKEARRKNINFITLKVLYSNTGAIRFYKRLGFELKNQEKHNVWMELRLN